MEEDEDVRRGKRKRVDSDDKREVYQKTEVGAKKPEWREKRKKDARRQYIERMQNASVHQHYIKRRSEMRKALRYARADLDSQQLNLINMNNERVKLDATVGKKGAEMLKMKDVLDGAKEALDESKKEVDKMLGTEMDVSERDQRLRVAEDAQQALRVQIDNLSRSYSNLSRTYGAALAAKSKATEQLSEAQSKVLVAAARFKNLQEENQRQGGRIDVLMQEMETERRKAAENEKRIRELETDIETRVFELENRARRAEERLEERLRSEDEAVPLTQMPATQPREDYFAAGLQWINVLSWIAAMNAVAKQIDQDVLNNFVAASMGASLPIPVEGDVVRTILERGKVMDVAKKGDDSKPSGRNTRGEIVKLAPIVGNWGVRAQLLDDGVAYPFAVISELFNRATAAHEAGDDERAGELIRIGMGLRFYTEVANNSGIVRKEIILVD